MKNLRFILFIGIVFVFLYSCTKEDNNDLADLNGAKKSLQIGTFPDQFCNPEPKELCLIAGQTINSGTVTMVNDEDNLYIKFATSGDILLKEVHVWIGDDLGNAPVNKQNTPVPGQFPYKMEKIDKSSVTLIIPLTEVPDDCFYILAHAALSNGETAWGAVCDAEMRWTFAEFFDTNRWGFLAEYCPASCDIIALKLRYIDPADGKEKSGIMSGADGFFKSDWCKLLGVNELVSKTYDLVNSYDVKIGTVDIAVYTDHFDVDVHLDITGATVKRTYLFYGTSKQLNSDLWTNGCPQFENWKIPGESAPSQTSFSVPII